MRNNLEKLLNNGTNPYINNDFSYIDDLLNNSSEKSQKKSNQSKIPENKTEVVIIENSISIKEAFEVTLKLKKNVMTNISFRNYELRIKKFLEHLPDENKSITTITKKDVITFLNNILEKSSPRNRNNYRGDLNSFFKELENNEYIENNFITKINVLKSTPERNKTFSDAKHTEIYEYLEKTDPLLLLFIKFITYNLLRPVEICRLKIKDVDVNESKLYIRAKNKPVKIKIIPSILKEDLPDLTKMSPEVYLFTPKGIGYEWKTEENNKRDYFSKRFNEVVKKKFNLNIDYGLYSFRHTIITKLYNKLREDKTPFEAKSQLMTITGHITMTALDKYLRDMMLNYPKIIQI